MAISDEMYKLASGEYGVKKSESSLDQALKFTKNNMALKQHQQLSQLRDYKIKQAGQDWIERMNAAEMVLAETKLGTRIAKAKLDRAEVFTQGAIAEGQAALGQSVNERDQAARQAIVEGLGTGHPDKYHNALVEAHNMGFDTTGMWDIDVTDKAQRDAQIYNLSHHEIPHIQETHGAEIAAAAARAGTTGTPPPYSTDLMQKSLRQGGFSTDEANRLAQPLLGWNAHINRYYGHKPVQGDLAYEAEQLYNREPDKYHSDDPDAFMGDWWQGNIFNHPQLARDAAMSYMRKMGTPMSANDVSQMYADNFGISAQMWDDWKANAPAHLQDDDALAYFLYQKQLLGE